jgi:hypothetical protein
MNRWSLILLLLLPAAQDPPDLAVQAEGGRVTVRARLVPLKKVLDRIAQETGVEVVYNGPEPSPLITVTIEDQPEREVLPRLLEGLGLNHALQMDASGDHVEILIINEAFGAGPASARSGGRTARRTPPPQAQPLGAVDEDPLEELAPDEVPPDPDELPPFGGGAYSGQPPDSEWTDTPADEGLDNEAPEFPSDASSPVRAGPYLRRPVFPGAASYP